MGGSTWILGPQPGAPWEGRPRGLRQEGPAPQSDTHPDCPAPEWAGYVTDRFTQRSSRVFSLPGTNVKGQWAPLFFHSLLLWYLNMLVTHFTHTAFVMIFADFPRYFLDLKFI